MIAVEVMLARRRGKKNATEGKTRSGRQVARYLKKHGQISEVVATLIDKHIEPMAAKYGAPAMIVAMALLQLKPVIWGGEVRKRVMRPQKTPEHFSTPNDISRTQNVMTFSAHTKSFLS
jgi:hypothetical protein